MKYHQNNYNALFVIVGDIGVPIKTNSMYHKITRSHRLSGTINKALDAVPSIEIKSNTIILVYVIPAHS